jgi:hypothetical protein
MTSMKTYKNKITLINELNDPDKFTMSDMNAKGFLKRLARIETNAQVIWDAVNSVFGDNYFTKIVEKEFGVNSNTFVSMNERISKKVNEFKAKFDTEFSIAKRQYETRISELQSTLNSKILELATIRETWERDENAIRRKVEEEFREVFDKAMAARIKMADEEKTELFAHIREIEETLDHYKRVAMNYYEACQDERWQDMFNINKEIDNISSNNEFIKKMLTDLDDKRARIEAEKQAKVSVFNFYKLNVLI